MNISVIIHLSAVIIALIFGTIGFFYPHRRNIQKIAIIIMLLCIAVIVGNVIYAINR